MDSLSTPHKPAKIRIRLEKIQGLKTVIQVYIRYDNIIKSAINSQNINKTKNVQAGTLKTFFFFFTSKHKLRNFSFFWFFLEFLLFFFEILGFTCFEWGGGGFTLVGCQLRVGFVWCQFHGFDQVCGPLFLPPHMRVCFSNWILFYTMIVGNIIHYDSSFVLVIQ